MTLAYDKASLPSKYIGSNGTIAHRDITSGFANVLEVNEFPFASGNRSTQSVFVGETGPGTDYDTIAKVGDKYIQLTYSGGAVATYTEFIRSSNGWEKVLVDNVFPVTDNTTGANTWTAAEVISGLLLRDPNGADRTDVLPTAALLVGALPNAHVGQTLRVVLVNTADADEVITLSAGSGGTLVPSAITVRYKSAKELIIRLTNVTASTEAYTVYDISNDGEKDQPAYSTSVTAAVDTAPTLTAAQILGGIITGVPTQARAYTLPAAADLLALLPNAIVGTTIEFTVVNNSAGNYAITVTASGTITNGALAGHLAVNQNCSATFKIRFTNVTASSEAAVFYRAS